MHPTVCWMIPCWVPIETSFIGTCTPLRSPKHIGKWKKRKGKERKKEKRNPCLDKSKVFLDHMVQVWTWDCSNANDKSFSNKRLLFYMCAYKCFLLLTYLKVILINVIGNHSQALVLWIVNLGVICSYSLRRTIHMLIYEWRLLRVVHMFQWMNDQQEVVVSLLLNAPCF